MKNCEDCKHFYRRTTKTAVNYTCLITGDQNYDVLSGYTAADPETFDGVEVDCTHYDHKKYTVPKSIREYSKAQNDKTPLICRECGDKIHYGCWRGIDKENPICGNCDPEFDPHKSLLRRSDEIEAEIREVEDLIQQSKEHGDPVGSLQYPQRLEQLKKELDK